MLVDGRSLESGRQLSTDVCVVGAGPAGLTLAGALREAGCRVVVVEAGGPQQEARGELLQSTVDVVGLPYAVRGTRRCGVGGSAPTWFVEAPDGSLTLRLREYDHTDFGARPWLGRTVGPWPLAPAQLRGPYQRARRLCGLPSVPDGQWGCWDGDLSESPVAPPGSGVETKPFDFGSRDHILDTVCRPVTRADDVTVLHDSPVVELRSDASADEVSSAVCRPGPHTWFSVSAHAFVLATGGVETPRLLLASRSRRSEGLGNQHGLVGRYFMEHPRCTAAIVVPGPRSPLRDPAVHAIHEHRGRPVQRKYGLAPARAEELGTANHAFFLRPTAPSHAAALVAERPEPSRWLRRPRRAARRLGARRLVEAADGGPVLTLEVMAEQLPDPASQVRLRRPPDGGPIPRAELDWRVDGAEWTALARATAHVAGALRAHGDARVLELLPDDGSVPSRLHKADHHMGTTRMDPDARRGVVDLDGRVHGSTNLYVAGSSAFPTAGGANPTLTILALTLRLADHLSGRLARPATTASTEP